MNISPDDPDNRFYECAEEANAVYIATGNRRDFPADYKNTKIVTPRQMVELVQSGHA